MSVFTYQYSCDSCGENLEGYTGQYCPVCLDILDNQNDDYTGIKDEFYNDNEESNTAQ